MIIYHIFYHKEKTHCNLHIISGLLIYSVGVAGFEPATLWSQTRCANRAALHPALSTVALAKGYEKVPQK